MDAQSTADAKDVRMHSEQKMVIVALTDYLILVVFIQFINLVALLLLYNTGAIIGGTDCETEEESDKCEKRVVDQIAWTTDSQKNVERNDSALLSTPSQLNRHGSYHWLLKLP